MTNDVFNNYAEQFSELGFTSERYYSSDYILIYFECSRVGEFNTNSLMFEICTEACVHFTYCVGTEETHINISFSKNLLYDYETGMNTLRKLKCEISKGKELIEKLKMVKDFA
jgi:hypothetical protein